MAINLDSYSMIFMDTAPFIYFFEDHPVYADPLEMLFRQVERGKQQIVTSLITYMEIITKPLKTGDTRLMEKYRAYFTFSKHLSLLPFTIQCAEETARIRCAYNLKTPDAIQVATALSYGADCIITNDDSWKKIKEIPVFYIDELFAP